MYPTDAAPEALGGASVAMIKAFRGIPAPPCHFRLFSLKNIKKTEG